MRNFLKGFLSVFDFGSAFAPRPNPRIQRIIERSKAAEQWYHDGPWWEHPMYGEGWKKK